MEFINSHGKMCDCTICTAYKQKKKLPSIDEINDLILKKVGPYPSQFKFKHPNEALSKVPSFPAKTDPAQPDIEIPAGIEESDQKVINSAELREKLVDNFENN